MLAIVRFVEEDMHCIIDMEKNEIVSLPPLLKSHFRYYGRNAQDFMNLTNVREAEKRVTVMQEGTSTRADEEAEVLNALYSG